MKKLLLALLAVVVVAGGAFYVLVVKDEPAEELSVDQPVAGGTTTTAADAGKTVDVTGTWNVTESPDTAVGFRIQEKFVGGTVEHTAVGRTAAVSGSLTVDGAEVTDGSFTADLTAIEFTDNPTGLDVSRRKRAIERDGLEIGQFPEATFTLTAPIDLGEVPVAGETITADATGDLTLHGQTKSVTFAVEAKIVNGTIVMATADPVTVVLADYGMTPPAFGPVADVADEGSFEFKVTLTKA